MKWWKPKVLVCVLAGINKGSVEHLDCGASHTHITWRINQVYGVRECDRDRGYTHTCTKDLYNISSVHMDNIQRESEVKWRFQDRSMSLSILTVVWAQKRQKCNEFLLSCSMCQHCMYKSSVNNKPSSLIIYLLDLNGYPGCSQDAVMGSWPSATLQRIYGLKAFFLTQVK